ncbi:choice-of-anchor F family protein [Thiomicrorhabdus lithotrophica]|uniref:Choice-of-anchor F family protein n=1 Tax=Thiomicrorhabdus lithotrophica TaxID=2949997 RepID=A0ABY8CCF1_9GAMM|nr:choice-of-anchor F family protein [Thiomicrorhabdus lithotrophica]WEJ63685.1 choice-of-anchor F family protein [Thiomicrorhabdus lithotrophica]
MKMKNGFKLSMITAAFMTATSGVQAANIVGITGDNSAVKTQGSATTTFYPTATFPLEQFGYGGLNLDNIDVQIVDAETGDELAKTFDSTAVTGGSYTEMEAGDSFASFINDGVNVALDDATGKLIGKDWPVGEPSGIKVVTNNDASTVYDSNGKPTSCIMSTSFHTFDELRDVADMPAGATITDGLLDSNYINPTMCDSSFQTHKRFKVSALPGSLVDDGSGNPKAIDMVFNIDAADNTTSRRYMILQKLNNYTGKHLEGYKLQVGFGVGTSFTPDTTGAVELSDGVGEMADPDGTLTVPTADIIDPVDMAVFSAGLFGAAEPPKHPNNGFFDATARAGFFAAEAGAMPKNTITSTGSMTTTYKDIFGSHWLPSIYEPKGIFWDDDNDTATDDRLVAFWSDYNQTPGDYMWLKGAADSFAPVTQAELQAWANSSEPYYVGGIEDVLNLGMTYMVDVNNMSATGPTSSDQTSFTLRMIPIEETDAAIAGSTPGWIANPAPADLSAYESVSDGTTTSSSGGSASVFDSTSLIISLLVLLGLGGWVARKKLAK